MPILLVMALAACGEEKKPPVAAAGAPSESSVTVSTVEVTTPTTAPTTTSTAPATTTTAAGLSDESRLGFEGIGPIKIGMTVAQAQAAVGKPIKVGEEYAAEGCAFAEVQGGPEELSFMVLRDKPTDPWKIFRADVHEGSPIATISGIRIGATEAQVKEAYSGKGGTYTVEPHPYTGPQGHYLSYDTDGMGGKLLIFETDGKKVTSFRAGEHGAVQAIEGCA